MPTTTAVSKLQKKFFLARVSAWGQYSEFRSGLGVTIDIGEGICYGQCLDWIRRILTNRMIKGSPSIGRSGGSIKITGLTLDETSTKKLSYFQKQVTTHKLMNELETTWLDILDSMLSHRTMQGREVNAFGLRELQVQQEFQRGVAQRLQNNGKGAPPRSSTALVDERRYAKFQILWRLYKSWVHNPSQDPEASPVSNTHNFDEIDLSIDRDMSFYGQNQFNYSKKYIWEEFLAPELLALASAEGRSAAIHSIESFKAMGKNQYEKDSGHVIAFYVEASGASHFFDPNIGWYAFKNVNAMEAFWKEVWETCYDKENYRVMAWLRFTRCSQGVVQPLLSNYLG